MAEFTVNIKGKEFTVEAENKEALPEIVETISAKQTPQKKEAWKISSPEELVGQGYNPIAAGLMATGQQLSQPLFKGVNTALLGLPQKALEAHGQKPPSDREIQAQYWKGKQANVAPALDVGAEIAGFVGGAPMKAGKAIAGGFKGLKGAGVGISAARGAIELGTAAALTTPPEEAFNDFASRATRTSIGALGGAVIGAAGSKLKSMGDVVKREVKIAKEVRGALKGNYSGRAANFEGSLYDETIKSNLKRADLSRDISLLTRDSRKALGAIAKKSDKVSDILRNPKDISLKQLQDAISEGKDILSAAKKTGKGLRASDKNVKSMLDKLQELKYREFPGMKAIDEAYGAISENMKVMDNALGKGKTMSAIRSAFKDAEKKEVLQELISPEMYSQLNGFVKSEKALKYGSGLINMFIKYGIIYKTLQSTLGKVSIGGDEVGAVHSFGNQ